MVLGAVGRPVCLRRRRRLFHALEGAVLGFTVGQYQGGQFLTNASHGDDTQIRKGEIYQAMPRELHVLDPFVLTYIQILSCITFGVERCFRHLRIHQ